MADRRRRKGNSDDESEEEGEETQTKRPPRQSDCESESDVKDAGVSQRGEKLTVEVEEEEEEDDDDDEYETEEEETEEEDEDDDAGTYDGEEDEGEGEVLLEEFIDGERQSGDGQEQPEGGEKVDDDEDTKNPAYVPRKGAFYEHDLRISMDNQADEDKKPKKRLWKDDGRWLHDKFRSEQQGPKSREEIMTMYGYDIRRAEKAPEGPLEIERPRGRRSEHKHQLSDFVDDKEYIKNTYNSYSNMKERGGNRYSERARGYQGERRGRGRGQRNYANSQEFQDRSEYVNNRNQEYRSQREFRNTPERSNQEKVYRRSAEKEVDSRGFQDEYRQERSDYRQERMQDRSDFRQQNRQDNRQDLDYRQERMQDRNDYRQERGENLQERTQNRGDFRPERGDSRQNKRGFNNQEDSRSYRGGRQGYQDKRQDRYEYDDNTSKYQRNRYSDDKSDQDRQNYENDHPRYSEGRRSYENDRPKFDEGRRSYERQSSEKFVNNSNRVSEKGGRGGYGGEGRGSGRGGRGRGSRGKSRDEGTRPERNYPPRLQRANQFHEQNTEHLEKENSTQDEHHGFPPPPSAQGKKVAPVAEVYQQEDLNIVVQNQGEKKSYSKDRRARYVGNTRVQDTSNNAITSDMSNMKIEDAVPQTQQHPDGEELRQDDARNKAYDGKDQGKQDPGQQGKPKRYSSQRQRATADMPYQEQVEGNKFYNSANPPFPAPPQPPRATIMQPAMSFPGAIPSPRVFIRPQSPRAGPVTMATQVPGMPPQYNNAGMIFSPPQAPPPTFQVSPVVQIPGFPAPAVSQVPPVVALAPPPPQSGANTQPQELIRGGTTYYAPELQFPPTQQAKQPAGGTTYYPPQMQYKGSKKSQPRRPKAAIPIVNPQDINGRGQDPANSENLEPPGDMVEYTSAGEGPLSLEEDDDVPSEDQVADMTELTGEVLEADKDIQQFTQAYTDSEGQNTKMNIKQERADFSSENPATAVDTICMSNTKQVSVKQESLHEEFSDRIPISDRDRYTICVTDDSQDASVSGDDSQAMNSEVSNSTKAENEVAKKQLETNLGLVNSADSKGEKCNMDSENTCNKNSQDKLQIKQEISTNDGEKDEDEDDFSDAKESLEGAIKEEST